MDVLIHTHFDPIFESHYITTSKYIDPVARKKRCYTLVKWAYSKRALLVVAADGEA